MEFTLNDAFLIFVAFLLAGFVKGMVGMGLPPIAMGILGLSMAPAQAAALVVIPSFLMNVWQMTAGVNLRRILKRFATLQIGVCIGTYAGSFFLDAMHNRYLSAALGATLILSAFFSYFTARWAIPPHTERWLSPIVGFLTGLVMAATGLVMVPLVPYLQSLNLDKETLMQSLGLSFVIAAVALGIILARAGIFHFNVAGASVLATVPVAIGMLLGRFTFKRIHPELFKIFFLIVLAGLGAAIIYRAFS